MASKTERMKAIKKDPFLNALQIKFAYALTCHKSQGGQWDAVFVDQGYLTEERIDKEYIRWLYTGVTRATRELYMVNFHKNFLLGDFSLQSERHTPKNTNTHPTIKASPPIGVIAPNQVRFVRLKT